jgi:lipid-A-disaccharide synthase
VFVGIDAPDFNLGLEKMLRKSGTRTVHYVSPSVWVWRAGRIETVRKAADLVLCILPFEKKIYDEKGIDAVFVGHPKATSLPADIDVASAREMLDIGAGPVVAVLPGSRVSEVERLGPVFATTAAMLLKHREDLNFITPVATAKLRPLIEQQLAAAGVLDKFCLVEGDSIEAMSAADVVLLASGTAALESALLGKPTVAAYAIAKLGAIIARIIGLRNKYFTIPNLVADEALIPEFIQEDVKAGALAQSVWELLEDPAKREEISRRFATLREELALGADERAADAVIELAG